MEKTMKALVKDKQDGRIFTITSDYATKKDFQADIKANGLVCYVISTPEDFDMAVERYEEKKAARLEREKELRRIKKEAAKKVEEVREEARREIEEQKIQEAVTMERRHETPLNGNQATEATEAMKAEGYQVVENDSGWAVMKKVAYHVVNTATGAIVYTTDDKESALEVWDTENPGETAEAIENGADFESAVGANYIDVLDVYGMTKDNGMYQVLDILTACVVFESESYDMALHVLDAQEPEEAALEAQKIEDMQEAAEDFDTDGVTRAVLNDVLQYGALEDMEAYLNDVTMHGCISGTVGRLIYTTDVHAFFDTHYDAISALVEDYENETGQALVNTVGDLKTFYTWFAYESAAARVMNYYFD